VAGGQRRILVVSSSGGVLLDLMAIRPWWTRHDVSWVAVDAPDTRELLDGARVTWASELTPSRPVDVVGRVRSARQLLRRQHIELVVSAGSGVAVPYFLAAKLSGTPAWWVQTLNVIEGAGLAARACTRLSELVIVQNSHLLADYPRALNVGELY
jgi:UDP-N-acetylglucosamine:LPS N-acetylglucosamine transferase